MASKDQAPQLLAFGEFLWDVFGSTEHVGGAAFNLAAHAARCGLNASLYSRVGSDDRGKRALVCVDRLNVGKRWVQIDTCLPTGVVNVTTDERGEPQYHIAENVAWDAIAGVSPEDRSEIGEFDVLIFGTLAQRSDTSRQALASLRKALPQATLFYDINLRGAQTPLDLVLSSLPGTTILKLNQDEFEILSRALEVRPDIASFTRLVTERFGTELVLLTRGEQGCQIGSRNAIDSVPAVPVKVASAVGAGDSFSAAFLSKWLRGASIQEAGQFANRVGAWVASRQEAVPEYPPDLAG